MNVVNHSALDASVLVLNKMFLAVHVISVRRAFCLLFKDLAEVVTLEDGIYQTYDFSTWREVSEFRISTSARKKMIGFARRLRKSKHRVSSVC